MTGDTWQMAHSVRWTFSQNLRFGIDAVWMILELKDQSVNQSVDESMNDGGDSRTVQATPGLLNIGFVN